MFAVEAQKPTNAVIGEFKAPEEDWKKKYEEERAKRYGIIACRGTFIYVYSLL